MAGESSGAAGLRPACFSGGIAVSGLSLPLDTDYTASSSATGRAGNGSMDA